MTQAVSFSSQLVRSFLGPEPVLVAQTLTSFDLRARNWRSEAETLLTAMYQADPTAVGTTGLETFEAIDTLLRAPTPPPSNGAAYPTGQHRQRAAAGGRAGQDRRRHALHLRQRRRAASTPTRTSCRTTPTTTGRSARRSPPSPPTSAGCSTTWC